MATFDPIYRLTLRDKDGTVVTPRAGAPHSDPFQIATATGITGFQPYMGMPEGRRGEIDPLERRTDTGYLMVRILDVRTTEGGDNAQRWVTAFTGDDFGRSKLIGRKATIEESTNGGSSWSDFFTGRVMRPAAPERLWMELRLRDMAEEQNIDVFVGDPASGVTYAHMGAVLPNGLIQSFGPFRTARPMRGTAEAWTLAGQGSGTELVVDPKKMAEFDPDGTALIATDALREVIAEAHARTVEGDSHSTVARVHVKITSGVRSGEEGEFWIAPGRFGQGQFIHVNATGKKPFIERVGIRELDASDPDFLALPPDTAEVEFWVRRSLPPTKDAPLFIDSVHPVQLWADLLDGKFSRLGTDRTPSFAAPRDTAAFDALIADVTIPKSRWVIRETKKLNDFVEEHICKPYNLAYRLNGSGEVVPIDMRPPSAVPSETITDADLDASAAPRWEQDRESAVTKVEITYYEDDVIVEDQLEDDLAKAATVPPSRIVTRDMKFILLDVGSPELGERTHRIDALGVRTSPLQGQEEFQFVEKIIKDHLLKRANEVRSPFGYGLATVELLARRTGDAATCQPGDFRVLNVAIPNASTVQRSGNRLAQCIGRREEKAKLLLTFMDWGADSVAVAPTLGNLSLVGGEEQTSIQLDVTLNASDEPVALHYNATDTSVAVRPAEGDEGWKFSRRVTGSGLISGVKLTGFPFNKRIWVRGRSEPDFDTSAKIPSGWVFPPTTDFIDTQTPAAPSAPATVSISGCSAKATWTNSNTIWPIDLRVDGDRYLLLPPGTEGWVLEGLSPSTGYTWTVGYVDTFGGESATATDTFTTTATPDVGPETLGLHVLVGVKA